MLELQKEILKNQKEKISMKPTFAMMKKVLERGMKRVTVNVKDVEVYFSQCKLDGKNILLHLTKPCSQKLICIN